MADMSIKDRATHGSKNIHAKLTEAQVAEIRLRVASGEVMRAVGADYGVNNSAVWRIVVGLRWRRADGPLRPVQRARVTKAMALEIRARIARGEPPRAVAALFGLDRTTVRRIGSGKTWSCLGEGADGRSC